MSGPARWQVACPAHSVTGGPEALHQLAHSARALGIDARMVYLDVDAASGRDVTALPFRVYEPVVDAGFDDRPDTLVILPETETHRLSGLRRAQRAIWWLSIDNHRVVAERARAQWQRYWWKRWSGRVALPFDLERPMAGVSHFAQSAYAAGVLQRHGIGPVLMLTDYLRDDFLSQARRGTVALAREPRRVAYNPKKGLDATQAVIAAAAGRFEFVPIENMTPAQVVELLCSAAVYIDFGHHPGRDRIPREAVACGCRLLTGRRGAAANEVDIPLPPALKIDEAEAGFAARAVAGLEQLIEEPGLTDGAFDAYRNTILRQKAIFADEVRTVAQHLRTPLRV